MILPILILNPLKGVWQAGADSPRVDYPLSVFLGTPDRPMRAAIAIAKKAIAMVKG
jgi:hypothetical protein